MSSHQTVSPFESIENAQDYLGLLDEELVRVSNDVNADAFAASDGGFARRLEALRLVSYKLERLQQHIHASVRILNDLRMLGRVLGCESPEAGAQIGKYKAIRSDQSFEQFDF